MLYVIIDPAMDYPIHMMNFLGRHGLKAIAVFTAPAQLYPYRMMWGDTMRHLVVDEYLSTDFPSVEALAERILREHGTEFQGIIPWAEMEIEFGAYLGHLLGIDWNHPDIIHRFRNKFVMKETLRRHGGIRVNASQVVHSVEEMFDFQERVGSWPIVVKPSQGAGSRAVFFVDNPHELGEAGRAVFQTGEGEVLLEEYIGGVEHVVNGITDHRGNVLVTDVWRYDKRDVSATQRNIYHQTIKVNTWEREFAPLARYATSVVHALGLRKAPVHMELKFDEYGPCLVEVGARFAGGNQPLLASECHGRSLFELAAVHYMDDGIVGWDDVNYEVYDRRQARIISGVQMYVVERVRGLAGYDEVQRLPSFYRFGKVMPPGSYLPITTDLMTRPYEVYLMNEDGDQMERDAQAVRALLHYY